MSEYAGLTYFIQAGKDGPIKVGFSQDPERRMRNMQTANAAELGLLLVLPGNSERQLHEALDKYRIRGEWFSSAPPVLHFIEIMGQELHDTLCPRCTGVDL